jgi:hypothetical protein
MRGVFAHEAVLRMAPDADVRAPGGAVTAALCGSWDHQPPCPLAPHHSHADRVGGALHLRILFAVEPESESEVRQRIDRALEAGETSGPDGTPTQWQLRSSHPSAVTGDEEDHAERLRTSC